MVFGQTLVAGSVVQGAKLRPWSSPSPPECGLGSKTAAQVTPVPARVWSREQNRAPGQALPRPSVV